MDEPKRRLIVDRMGMGGSEERSRNLKEKGPERTW